VVVRIDVRYIYDEVFAVAWPPLPRPVKIDKNAKLYCPCLRYIKLSVVCLQTIRARYQP